MMTRPDTSLERLIRIEEKLDRLLDAKPTRVACSTCGGHGHVPNPSWQGQGPESAIRPTRSCLVCEGRGVQP